MPGGQDDAPAFGGLDTSFDKNNEGHFGADVEMQTAGRGDEGVTTATTGAVPFGNTVSDDQKQLTETLRNLDE